MQLFRTKFRKSFILSTKKWIKSFPGKNPVNSREKSGDITAHLISLVPVAPMVAGSQSYLHALLSRQAVVIC